jgi:hypothetical protein
MVFTNVINPRSHVNRKNEYQRTLVGKGATLGANCTVVCGHTIGRYAFVAAGAVVTSDVPDYALVMGMPARHTGWMCVCGERLRDAIRRAPYWAYPQHNLALAYTQTGAFTQAVTSSCPAVGPITILAPVRSPKSSAIGE